MHTSAINSPAVITLHAPGSGYRRSIAGVAFSYDSAPAGGRVTVSAGSVILASVAVTRDGAGFIPGPFTAPENTDLVLTLTAAGIGIQGDISAIDPRTITA